MYAYKLLQAVAGHYFGFQFLCVCLHAVQLCLPFVVSGISADQFLVCFRATEAN